METKLQANSTSHRVMFQGEIYELKADQWLCLTPDRDVVMCDGSDLGVLEDRLWTGWYLMCLPASEPLRSDVRYTVSRVRNELEADCTGEKLPNDDSETRIANHKETLRLSDEEWRRILLLRLTVAVVLMAQLKKVKAARVAGTPATSEETYLQACAARLVSIQKTHGSSLHLRSAA